MTAITLKTLKPVYGQNPPGHVKNHPDIILPDRIPRKNPPIFARTKSAGTIPFGFCLIFGVILYEGFCLGVGLCPSDFVHGGFLHTFLKSTGSAIV